MSVRMPKQKTLVATCTCEDFFYRSGGMPTQRDLNLRWGNAQQLLVLGSRETGVGIREYTIKSPEIEKSSYEVTISYGNGDQIDWPCKHILRVISEEMRRLHGLCVDRYLPEGVQLLTGEKVVIVDGKLQAVVMEETIEV